MANVKEQAMTLKTTLADTDWIRVGSATQNQRMTIATFKSLMKLNDTTTVNLTPAAGWTINTSFGTNIQAKKNANGIVSLAGVIVKTSAVAQNEVITTLPVGYRPTNRMLFSVTGPNYAPTEVEVSTTGDILIRKASTQIAYMSLANILFQI